MIPHPELSHESEQQFLFDDVGSPYLSPIRNLQSPSPDILLSTPSYYVFDCPPIPSELSDATGVKEEEKKREEKKERKKKEMLNISEVIYYEGEYFTRIKHLVEVLVDDEKEEKQIWEEGMKCCRSSTILQYIFQTLLQKFNRLKKTKEEMIKYCIRKAFKFASETKPDPIHQEEFLNFMLFNGINDYRKNTSEKTINSFFLKELFSDRHFVIRYKLFLEEFPSLMMLDNANKIESLTKSVMKFFGENRPTHIEKIRRLPWTNSIMNKTRQVANELIEYSSECPSHQKNGKRSKNYKN